MDLIDAKIEELKKQIADLKQEKKKKQNQKPWKRLVDWIELELIEIYGDDTESINEVKYTLTRLISKIYGVASIRNILAADIPKIKDLVSEILIHIQGVVKNDGRTSN